MHVSTYTPRFYILGTAELIVLKFATWAETDMICGFNKAMGGVSARAQLHTPSLFRVLAWIGWFKVDHCGISRGNFQPTWHVQVTLRHLSCARSFIAHKALYWFANFQVNDNYSANWWPSRYSHHTPAAWMTYYWMGHSLFLTISMGDHTLTKEGFNSFTGGKKH